MKGYVRENTQQITAGYSALRKCRNAVSAGVLSPISSAVGRNGAVGDKESARTAARNYPRRRQILRLRRCAATPHPSRLRRATCLPAGRSVRGSDTPPACHSIQRTPGGRLEGCADRMAIIKSRLCRRKAAKVGVPVGHGYNYFLACDTAERIIFAVVTGSGSGKLCWHSRGNDNDQENAGYVRESAGGSEQA